MHQKFQFHNCNDFRRVVRFRRIENYGSTSKMSRFSFFIRISQKSPYRYKKRRFQKSIDQPKSDDPSERNSVILNSACTIEVSCSKSTHIYFIINRNDVILKSHWRMVRLTPDWSFIELGWMRCANDIDCICHFGWIFFNYETSCATTILSLVFLSIPLLHLQCFTDFKLRHTETLSNILIKTLG